MIKNKRKKMTLTYLQKKKIYKIMQKRIKIQILKSKKVLKKQINNILRMKKKIKLKKIKSTSKSKKLKNHLNSSKKKVFNQTTYF